MISLHFNIWVTNHLKNWRWYLSVFVSISICNLLQQILTIEAIR